MTENWRSIAGSEGTFEDEVEEWREIPGWEGRYEVSSWGRCRSLDRIVIKTTRGRPVPHKLKGRVLRPGRTQRGYLTVVLAARSVYVHRVVLLAWTGPPPPGHQTAHNNGDKLDNRPSNLRYATAKDNTADRYRHGTVLYGARHPQGRKTHCKRGHPFDGSRRADGRRACATCQRECRRIARRAERSRRSAA
jgi:hypothetical protein